MKVLAQFPEGAPSREDAIGAVKGTWRMIILGRALSRLAAS